MLQKINKKLSRNQKGFSLIELMIAVAILALAAFGIFQAFSIGFQGMADARDRTEAVNYIQKTLEEYKNTPFVKIIDKPMSPIAGTKFSNGSIVIEKETRLKKVITQVRWIDRNGDIKLEEASTLIYATEKTGELLSASEIILYASPYFRILPLESTDLFAEIHDANGNIVTDEVYTVDFEIIDGSDLGYLSGGSDDTTNGIASVEYISDTDVADGSVMIKASADLPGVGTVSDTIEIIISIGAEGIILVPSPDSSLAGTSVNVDLYVVDASFDYELEGGSHIIPYDGEITLSASSVPEGIATLSTTTITDTASDGRASFNLNSNGTPGTVEIIASAPDLDLGYTEVTFTGGAESIRLTPNYGEIYEGESIKITITILDENNNPTPFSGSITMASVGGGSFDHVDPDPFFEQSSGTVNFYHGTATDESIKITATGDGGLTSNTIYIDVLDSLTPSYIELTADPNSVKANGGENDYSFITATVYDDSDPAEVVINYTTPITFTIYGDVGYFLDLDGTTEVYTSLEVIPSSGQAYTSLYSDFSGTTTVTATSGALTEDSTDIAFYSSASYILLTTNSGSAVANGEDYAVITATVYDADDNIVTNYLDDIEFSVSGVGYFAGDNSVTPTDGIAQIKLYSNDDGTATVTAESYDESQLKDLDLQPVEGIDIDFTQPQNPEIQLLEETVTAYYGKKIVQFEVEVTNANLLLDIIEISWSDSASNLKKIEIASPTSELNYDVIYDDTASYPGTTIYAISKTLLMGNSIFKITFDDNMNNESINITLTDESDLEYSLDEINI